MARRNTLVQYDERGGSFDRLGRRRNESAAVVVQQYVERGGSWGELKLRCALEACRTESAVSTAFKKRHDDQTREDVQERLDSRRQSVQERLDSRRQSIQEASIQEASKAAAEARKQAARKQKKKTTSSKYPRADIELIKQIFDEYDVDGNGRIELTELWAALRRQRENAQRYDGRRRSLAERQAATGVVTGKRLEKKAGAQGVFISSQALPLFDAMDRDGDGTVTFRELLHCLYPHCAAGELETMLGWVTPPEAPAPEGPRLSQASRAEINRLFTLYDADGSGGITVAELHAALATSCALDAGEVTRLFAQFDADRNRVIDREEFGALMASTGAFYD